MAQQKDAVRRVRLTKDRVLRAAVALADKTGIDSLNMRNLALELGVVPMALYKHVANKEELLDGMVDLVVGEIEAPLQNLNWKSKIRARILLSRQVLLRHPWASRVIESRITPTPAVLDYMNSLIGMFRDGGFSIDLIHHFMHALGSRMLGFTQDVFDDSQKLDPETLAVMVSAMSTKYPYLAEMASAASHDDLSVVGPSCDDQFEFEFALDLLLDGFEKLRLQG